VASPAAAFIFLSLICCRRQVLILAQKISFPAGKSVGGVPIFARVSRLRIMQSPVLLLSQFFLFLVGFHSGFLIMH
jgi:hypothetical protein